jgi:uncharacterized protein
MSVKRYLAVACFSLGSFAILAESASAASFDCRPYDRTGQCPEAVICETPKLSQLDSEMADQYFQLKDSLRRRKARALKREQKAWLEDRDDCGCDATCIEAEYQRRLDELFQY